MIARTLLTASLGWAAASAQAGTLVAFRSHAAVTEGVVTLGDVADVRSSDPAAGQKLSAIILGPGPDTGREALFTFETVRSRLLAAGVNLAETEFSGPSSVAVRGSSDLREATDRRPEPVPTDVRDRARRAAAAAVRRYIASKGAAGGLAIELRLPESELSTVADAAGIEVAGGVPPWTGTQTYTLRFLDTTERIREVRAVCAISERPSVLAARHALPKGHLVRPDDLVWKTAEDDAEAACATAPDQLLGRETQQSVRAGRGVRVDSTRAVPLVRNGQFVTVTSRRPGLCVQRIMKAKGDGTAGETIPLLTLEDRKTVFARVTGLQEAEVVDPATATAAEAASARVNDNPAGPAADPAFGPATQRPAAGGDPRPRVMTNPSQPLSVPARPAG